MTGAGVAAHARLSSVLLPVGLCSFLCCACDGVADGGFGFGTPLPAPAEVTTTKRLTLHLDADRPALRFSLPTSVTPATGNCRIDVVVARTTDALRLEIASESFATPASSAWPVVSTGFAGTVFVDAVARQNVILGVGLAAPDDVAVDVDVDLTLACPDDSDFDGVADGVVVELAPLEPLP